MNDVPLPLTDEHVDELLSAELDGEFDAAAADLGLDAARARAQLEEIPAIDDRRAAMRAAREALSAPADLDDVTAARMRAEALRAFATPDDELASVRRRRRSRPYVAVGAIAAAIVLVFGVAVALNNSSTNNAKSVAAVASPYTTVAPRAVGSSAGTSLHMAFAYGNYKDAQSLTDALASDAYSKNKSMSVAANALPYSNAFDASPSPSTVSTHCDTIANQLTATTGAPDVRGTATINGTPVVVYEYRRPTERIVLVLTTDCKFVSRQATATK